MNSRRLITALWPHWLFCMMLTPCCLANQNVDIPKFIPPVQNYAVIDISGDKTSDVELVALDDANNAAFCFGTGQVPAGWSSGPEKYHVYTWTNGTLGTEQVTNALHIINTTANSQSGILAEEPKSLAANGQLYGDEYVWRASTYPLPSQTYTALNGGVTDMSLPDPPFHDFSDSAINLSVGPSSSDGKVIVGVASGRFSSPPNKWFELGFILKDGVYTIFDAHDYSGVKLPSTVVLKNSFLAPTAANKSGHAVGTTGYGGPTSSFWDGQTMHPMGAGEVVALNDQDQAVVQDDDSYAGIYSSGYLWEHGSSSYFLDKLPSLIEIQYNDIQPLAIGNQVDPTSDVTIHILTDGDGIDVGDYGKMIWNRGNNGKWTFANIALPAGTTITEENWNSARINSSGVIAAIGNGGHALLLVPINFTVDKWTPVITVPSVHYILYTGTNSECYYIDTPNEDDHIMDVQAKVKIDIPDVAQVDAIASEWDVDLYQNIVVSDPGAMFTYSDSAPSLELLSPIPALDTNGEDPKEDGAIPHILPFSKNHEQLTLSMGDSPAQSNPHVLYRPGRGYVTGLSRNNEFITYLFAEHRSDNRRVYLKWFRWRAAFDILFNFSNGGLPANPTEDKLKWEFEIIDQGEGMGPIAPVDTYYKRTSINP